MGSRFVLLLLLLSLFSTFSSAKPRFKLIEVEDKEGEDNQDISHTAHKLVDDKEDSNDYQLRPQLHPGLAGPGWAVVDSDLGDACSWVEAVKQRLSC